MRVRVPKRLRTILPSERIKSFGAVSYKDACRLGWAARSEIEREFEKAELRLGLAAERLLLPLAPTFTEAELIDVARRYLSEREGVAVPIPLSGDAQLAMRESSAEQAYSLGHPEALDDAGIHALAEGFAERQGYRLPNGEERYSFLEAIQAALLEHHERIIARLDGATVATINPAFSGVQPRFRGQRLTNV